MYFREIPRVARVLRRRPADRLALHLRRARGPEKVQCQERGTLALEAPHVYLLGVRHPSGCVPWLGACFLLKLFISTFLRS